MRELYRSPQGESPRAISNAPVAGVRIATILRPTVLLAFRDGAGFVEHDGSFSAGRCGRHRRNAGLDRRHLS